MTTTPSHCLECNAPLSHAETQGLCARCLLKMGLASQFGESSVADAGARKFVPPPMFPFDFGGYRVLRLLGRGGMGAVYEAEQLATGRRVALKVLGHTIDSAEMRKRFLREGRLAASVNHPNSVYIFGTEEIEDAPVIAMELVAGGTLRDRIREGPLPPREAVDAVLQVIAGLEAAACAGVLHRDVKPANCFVAPDGTVKVGDFGLSVSTLARHDSQLTVSGVMLGTPSYAPPEQLRGDELDVRADIYSVGATLYSLLTGRAPFEGDDAVQVVTAVLDKMPKPIAAFRPDVPAGLAQVVARCLAKKRDDRFADYASLRDALLPFSSHVAEPAPLGLRTVAGVIDCLIATSVSTVLMAATGMPEEYRFLSERTFLATLEFLGVMLLGVAYLAIPEGLWGASVGKALCGLRVAPRDFGRVAGRAFIVMLAIHLGVFFELFVSTAAEFKVMVTQDQVVLSDIVGPPILFLLFVTMRRRNGFAAIHDLITGTRVIVRPQASARPRLDSAPVAATESGAGDRIGPFRVVAPLAEGWLAAYDDVLRRNVWIRRGDAGTPALPPARRDLGRAGRLRWIAGVREEAAAWDAFDAPTGQPLASLSAQPWAAVRCWLLDLAEEINAASHDGTLPPEIGVEHVWITANGRALLLDEPQAVTAASPMFRSADTAETQRFLSSVSDAALDRTRLPLHARDFLQKLAAAAFDRVSFLIGNLHSLIAKPAVFSRWRRFTSMALAPALALAVGVPASVYLLVENRREEARWAPYPELRLLPIAVDFHDTLDTEIASQVPPVAAELTDDMKVRTGKFIAGHFGAFVESAEFDRHPATVTWSPEFRAAVRATVRRYTPVAAEELKRIDGLLQSALESQVGHMAKFAPVVVPALIGLVLAGMCVTQFVSLLIFRTTPGQRLFSFAVVNKHGEPAGRGRMLWRWVIIWLPLLILATLITSTGIAVNAPHHDKITALALIWLAAIILAVARPDRGLHDEFSGTRVVPR